TTELDEEEEKFGGDDSLVINFTLREGPNAPQTDRTPEELREFQRRLADGNPYQLDRSGQLYLPGVPAIAMAGLNVDEAVIRLEAERSLRMFEVEITRLPLEPIGINALRPFGYDLFEDEGRGVGLLLSPTTNMPVPSDYVVGPGDTINVQLFGNQNAEYFLTVSGEGFVSFPEIGPLNVAGLPFSEVRNLVNERVAEQMIGVRASITLGELRSIQVFVVGDVERPGAYIVGGMSTILHALLESGGVKRIGSLRDIRLRRGGETVAVFDLYDMLLEGDTSADVRLQPGDVVLVPAIGPTVAIDGDVKRPAIYEISDETTVGQALQLAGGLNATANRSRIRIERIASGGGIDVQEVDSSTAAGLATVLRDGDVLRVSPNPSLLENSVRLEGNVFQTGLHEWTPGMRLTDLLPRSSLVKPLSDLNYVLIRRQIQPNVSVEAVSADLERAWAIPGGAADVALQPGDTVYVFNL